MVFVDLSGSEAPKIHPKSMSKRARKKQRKKTSEKSILASILASQNLPKIDPASKNVWLNFMLEIETSGRSANQRKPAQTSATQIWSFGWLGLNKGGLGLAIGGDPPQQKVTTYQQKVFIFVRSVGGKGVSVTSVWELKCYFGARIPSKKL